MNGILLTVASNADISIFLEFGTSVLTWMLTSFGSIVTFLMTNPIAVIGIILSLIGTCFVYLRSTIGG